MTNEEKKNVHLSSDEQMRIKSSSRPASNTSRPSSGSKRNEEKNLNDDETICIEMSFQNRTTNSSVNHQTRCSSSTLNPSISINESSQLNSDAIDNKSPIVSPLDKINCLDSSDIVCERSTNKFEANCSSNKFHSDRIDLKWVDPQYNNDESIIKPGELQIESPPGPIDENILNRIQGSIIGMALGDALGAHVEFRPYEYMINNPVKDFQGGGTWDLQKGQFTDDTSMALCLANSLIACQDFRPYDQMIRYKWWYRLGYMSSTGQCFDIGAATSQSLTQFEQRQKSFAEKNQLSMEEMDKYSNYELMNDFDVYCSEDGVAGNGALMRLAPVPLFFYRNIFAAIEFSGRSGEITHGDRKAADACRFYGALIAAAVRGLSKKELLDRHFYKKHRKWFGEQNLHEDIVRIAQGSYLNKKGYSDGIRGKGFIVAALEAALWAFSSTNNFEDGALAAVNLGDDTDTTAAIYGQLAGAVYGYSNLPPHWLEQIYAHQFMKTLSQWIVFKGEQWEKENQTDLCQRFEKSKKDFK